MIKNYKNLNKITVGGVTYKTQWGNLNHIIYMFGNNVLFYNFFKKLSNFINDCELPNQYKMYTEYGISVIIYNDNDRIEICFTEGFKYLSKITTYSNLPQYVKLLEKVTNLIKEYNQVSFYYKCKIIYDINVTQIAHVEVTSDSKSKKDDYTTTTQMLSAFNAIYAKNKENNKIKYYPKNPVYKKLYTLFEECMNVTE